ncbi:hypothetical protein ACWCOP_10845 [Maricaulaceae bacterium MS644]
MPDRIETSGARFAPGAQGAQFAEGDYGLFASALIQLEPEDVGQSTSSLKIEDNSVIAEIFLGAVSVTSWAGVTGALLALGSELLSVFNIQIDPTFAEGSLICPGDACVITAGLTVLTAMEWVVATAGFALGLAGHLGVHAYRMGRIRTTAKRFTERTREMNVDRYLVTSLGQTRFRPGKSGLRIEAEQRDFVIEWDAVDEMRLYWADDHLPRFKALPRVEVAERPTDLRSFVKDDIRLGPYAELYEALKKWSEQNAHLDLPIKNERTGDTKIREWIRLPRGAFNTRSSNLTWFQFIALVWFCVKYEPPNHNGVR